MKERERDRRMEADKIDAADQAKKARVAAEEIRREKQRFAADLENLALQASKEGELAKKHAVSNQDSI